MTIPSLDPTPVIRPMRLEDVEQVQAIDRASFSMPWPISAYDYELTENPVSLLWVAEVMPTHDDGTGACERPCVVGMIVVWLIMDEAHVATIATHPDYRGRGIAHDLLATALKESIRRGAKMSTLEVREHNTVAQQIYRRFQFEVVGVRPRYYRDNNEDALIMTVNNLGETYIKWLENGEWKQHSSTLNHSGVLYRNKNKGDTA